MLSLFIIALLVSQAHSFAVSKIKASSVRTQLFSERVEEPQIFSDCTLNHLNYVIEKLGNRLRKGESLNLDEAGLFEKSINAIIDESKQYEFGWSPTAAAAAAAYDVDYDAPLDRRMSVGDIVLSGEGTALMTNPIVDDECYLGANGELEECADFDPVVVYSPPPVVVYSPPPVVASSSQSVPTKKPAVIRFSGDDRFDGILDRLQSPVLNPELVKSSAFTYAADTLGPNVPRTKEGTPATKELIAQGQRTHQKLGKIQTNTWGTDPFAGFNFEGTDDEEDSPRMKERMRNQDVPGIHRPAKSWGKRKYADANSLPTGYDSRKDKTSPEYGQGSSLNQVMHPHGEEGGEAFAYDG
jgi:hypothetical protein